MRVYVSGQGVFPVHACEELTKADHTILGVSAPPLRKGQGTERDPTDWDRLRTWAHTRGIPWTPAEDLRANRIPDDTDLILSLHSHAFLGRRIRERARVACLGYHPSLLPLHRGRDAVRWTIRDRDRVTGGTVYHLTERVDGGPIAAQRHVLVPPGYDAQRLWREMLAPLGVRLVLGVVGDLDRGVRVELPQDEACATWEPAMNSPPMSRPD